MKTLDFSGNTKGSRIYKTYATAVAKATEQIEKMPAEVRDNVTLVIAATPDGRFAPVFRLHTAAQWSAVHFATKGFYVM